MASKRCSSIKLLSLTFVSKSISKSLLIKNLYSNRLKSISVICIFCDIQFEILSLSQLFNNKHVNFSIKKVIINTIDKD